MVNTSIILFNKICGILIILAGLVALIGGLAPIYEDYIETPSWNEVRGQIVAVDKFTPPQRSVGNYLCNYNIAFDYESTHNTTTEVNKPCNPDLQQGADLSVYINPKDASDVRTLIESEIHPIWIALTGVIILLVGIALFRFKRNIALGAP